MSEPARITVRYAATPSSSVAYVNYKNVVMTIRIQRSGDADQDLRNLKTVLANLPEVLQKGSEEFWVQDQVRRLDHELEEFFRDLDADEGKGTE